MLLYGSVPVRKRYGTGMKLKKCSAVPVENSKKSTVPVPHGTGYCCVSILSIAEPGTGGES